jgi:hypothetical protein
VINVRVREDRGAERFGIEGQMRVAVECLGTMALGESAVEQNAPSFAFDQLHRAGDGARRATEAEFHGNEFRDSSFDPETRNGKSNSTTTRIFS